eukprot:m.226796 g.226796  ORF g.226796 m.226796 type:complete len:509 (-) comp17043_c0_seq1:205-1731(-)
MAAQLAPLVQAACASAAAMKSPASLDPSEERAAAAVVLAAENNNIAEVAPNITNNNLASKIKSANSEDEEDEGEEGETTFLSHESPQTAARLCTATNKKGEYVCTVCEKAFKGRIGLRRHMHLHTGQSPYQCDRCSASFGYIGNLKRHLRIHTGEKPFSCKHCGRAFSDDSHRRSHEKIHTQDERMPGSRSRGLAGSSDEPEAHHNIGSVPAVASRPRSVRAAARRRRVPARDGSSDSEDPYITDADDTLEETRPSVATVPNRPTTTTTHTAAAAAAEVVSMHGPENRRSRKHSHTLSHGSGDYEAASNTNNSHTLPPSSANSPRTEGSGRPLTSSHRSKHSQHQQQQQEGDRDQSLAYGMQSPQPYDPTGAYNPNTMHVANPVCSSAPPMFMPAPPGMFAAGAPGAAGAMAGPEAALMYQRIMQAHMQSFALMAAQYGLAPSPHGMPPHPMPTAPPSSLAHTNTGSSSAPPMQMMPMPMPYYPGFSLPPPPQWAHSAPLPPAQPARQ